MARGCVGLWLLCVVGVANAAAEVEVAPPNAQVAALLERVTISASTDERQQVVDAIAASPALTERLASLASVGGLTAIDVVAQPAVGGAAPGASVAATPIRGPFAAAIDGSRIVMGSSLLRLLRRARLFDVAQPDDVLPNQTVFVLAHLASHLADPGSSRPGPGIGLEAYVDLRLGREARAYIDAWNISVEEAVRRHDGVPLSDRQVASLLLNERYRFAFLGLRASGVAGPTRSTSGAIEATPANIDAIVRTLKQSAIADLE